MYKSVGITFVLITLFACVIEYVFAAGTVGGSTIGFPIPFLHTTSAPPPAEARVFVWWALGLDLLLYFAVAVLLGFIRKRTKHRE